MSGTEDKITCLGDKAKSSLEHKLWKLCPAVSEQGAAGWSDCHRLGKQVLALTEQTDLAFSCAVSHHSY